MTGYDIGQRPPGLAQDGSFDTPLSTRAFSVVDTAGNTLVVDKTTELLVKDEDTE